MNRRLIPKTVQSLIIGGRGFITFRGKTYRAFRDQNWFQNENRWEVILPDGTECVMTHNSISTLIYRNV